MSEKYIVSSNVSFCPQVKDITVTDGQDPEKDLEKKMESEKCLSFLLLKLIK